MPPPDSPRRNSNSPVQRPSAEVRPARCSRSRRNQLQCRRDHSSTRLTPTTSSCRSSIRRPADPSDRRRPRHADVGPRHGLEGLGFTPLAGHGCFRTGCGRSSASRTGWCGSRRRDPLERPAEAPVRPMIGVAGVARARRGAHHRQRRPWRQSRRAGGDARQQHRFPCTTRRICSWATATPSRAISRPMAGRDRDRGADGQRRAGARRAMVWPRSSAGSHRHAGARPLEDAARIAFEEMIHWLEDDYGIPAPEAYMLLGQIAEAPAAMVNPNTPSSARWQTPSRLTPPARQRLLPGRRRIATAVSALWVIEPGTRRAMAPWGPGLSPHRDRSSPARGPMAAASRAPPVTPAPRAGDRPGSA